MLRHIISAVFPLLLASACATDSEDTTVPREATQTGPLVGRTIEFALDVDALDDGTMQAIGQRVEQQTGAESLSVEVEKSPEGGTSVVMQVWGRGAIGNDALTADLRAQFPALKNAMIAIAPLEGEGPAGGLGEIEVDKDEDPEVVKQQVMEQLRAKGVQGDVEVHVDDHDDGKREVRVEVKDEKHLTPAQ